MKKKPQLLAGISEFILAVDAVYRSCLPKEYALHMQYTETVLPYWRLDGTPFTTVYAIKNLPTACHRDEFDAPEGFGVLATLGEFAGAELCFPQYGVAVDYQPGDVLLADVHELHGNLPLLRGERLTSVFFTRKGMHECPGLEKQ